MKVHLLKQSLKMANFSWPMKRDGVGKMLLQVTPKDERKRGAKEEGEKF